MEQFPQWKCASQLRRERLRRIIEGRREQLNEMRHRSWPPSAATMRDYNVALAKYIRARKAWRAFWEQ
jgi:hypothetical protein